MAVLDAPTCDAAFAAPRINGQTRLFGLLTYRGDIAGALQTILTDPPYGEGVDQAKVSLDAAHGDNDVTCTGNSIFPADRPRNSPPTPFL